MKKTLAALAVLGMVSACQTTGGGGQSASNASGPTDLEADLAAGSQLLTTSEALELHEGNTVYFGGAKAFYSESGTRVLEWQGKKYRTPWRVIDGGEVCVVSARTKVEECNRVAKTADGNYQYYKDNGDHDLSFSVAEGDAEGLR